MKVQLRVEYFVLSDKSQAIIKKFSLLTTMLMLTDIGVGRGARVALASLEFEIWHFYIKYLAKNGRFLSFAWVK